MFLIRESNQTFPSYVEGKTCFGSADPFVGQACPNSLNTHA